MAPPLASSRNLLGWRRERSGSGHHGQTRSCSVVVPNSRPLHPEAAAGHHGKGAGKRQGQPTVVVCGSVVVGVWSDGCGGGCGGAWTLVLAGDGSISLWSGHLVALWRVGPPL